MVRDEGFLSPAGTRFVLIAAVLLLAGVLAYLVISEEITIDLDELTQTSSTTDTGIETELREAAPPEQAAPGVPRDRYLRCISRAETAAEIVACGER